MHLVSVAPAPLVKNVLHHPPLHIHLDRRRTRNSDRAPVPVRYDFLNADFNSISALLSAIDWDNILDKDDADAAAQTFSHVLAYVIDRHVPKKICHRSGPPWQSARLKKLKREKRAAFRKYSKRRTLPLRDYYVRLNSYYKYVSRQCYASYQYRVQQNLKSWPKSFWKYVKQQRNE